MSLWFNSGIIHPSCLSRTWSWDQQPKQRSPNLSLPSHLPEFIQGNKEPFPGHLTDIIYSAWLGFAPRPLSSRKCPEHFTQEALKRHPCHMPQKLEWATSAGCVRWARVALHLPSFSWLNASPWGRGKPPLYPLLWSLWKACDYTWA